MYLVFDTETTGLPKNFNAPLSDSENWPRMVQIAWQLHDDDGKLIENQDYIIKTEGYDIPFNAARIHGITTKIANDEGRDLQEVLEEFSKVLDKVRIVSGHNVEFDYNIVGAEFFRKNMKDNLQEKPKADTMILGTDFCQLGGGRGGRFKPPKLEELYEKLYGNKFDEAHNAAADVNATAQVFFEMMRVGIIPAELLKISEDQLKYFQTIYPGPIQPFDIVIRRQVADFHNKKKQTDFGSIDDIDLGKYFNFDNHSVFSTLTATSGISDLIKKAVDNNFPAVGIVDLGNMMGAFKFVSAVESVNSDRSKKHKEYLAKKQEAEENATEFNEAEPSADPLIPIVGCEFYISDRYEQKQFTKDDPDRRTQVVLLAKDFNGYKNLAKLSSIGFLKGFYFGVPRISRELIAQYKEGLIALTSGINGDIPDAILNTGEQKGEELFKWWKDTFEDDFYVQIQNHNLPEEEHLNGVLLYFADKYNVKILAQNETFYTNKDDANIQDIVSCIKDGEKLTTPVGKGFGKRRGLATHEYYIKNRDEIKEAFLAYPDAFDAYEEFLAKFSPYTLKRDVLLPKFDIPEEFVHPEDELDGGKRGEMAYLTHLTYEGARKKYAEITEEIKERLDFELDVIANTGYPGYFLIVQDFCNEARNMGVWVGPGRGSAAGSAVAYCIGITNVDPIAYDLLFERFLNPERISMPDIDIDFDDEGRDKIIKWVIEKYGQSQVAQIITYSVLGGKSAIKDAGRVLDLPIPDTNNIAKLIPSTPGMNIAKALSKYDKLRPEDQMLVDEMRLVLDNPDDPRFSVLASAKKMEGCIRNTGIHACGVIITPEDVSNLVPVTIAAKDADILVSQFDNSVAESAGLLKMDFLGLRTLTIIKDAIKIVKEKHGIEINPDDIPLDDAKTYQLFKEGRTIGIFQYESPGMQKYMRELKPTVFADLIAMNALYRPGPIKYIPNFINRKHGIEEIVYDLPETEEYLKETYGITVYQEQVMLLSQKLANFTKGEADTLRKAMGKKQIDVLNKMYPKFIEGGKKNNLDEEKLNKIWNDWKAFAEYAFNKSHSTCYALVAYHTAYLKANYPAEYMASVMSNNINNTAQITMFMEDCKSMGVDVLGPDVNESQYKFSVNEKGQIRFGLGAIKGIGEGPSEAITREREKGRFKNIYDFFERILPSQMNKRVAESLVVAGAFDELDIYHRGQYFDIDSAGRTNLERLIRYGQSFQESKNEMEHSLFADFAEEVQIEQPKLPPCPEWPNMHKLNKEKEIIGFYLSAHPLDEFRYHFQFMQGQLSKKKVLEKDEEEKITQDVPPILEPETQFDSIDVAEIIPDEIIAGEEEIIEETTKKAEPKGTFGFLNLDELDAYKEQTFAHKQEELFEEKKKDWKQIQKDRENGGGGKEYTVAGLITEYRVQDGFRSGEKVAFLTLEDYSGSYSFRLGDRDYMRLKEKLEVQRFVILKIKFAQVKDGRVFVNVNEVIELQEAFERFAKSISLVMDVMDFRQEDLVFFQNIVEKNRGDQKLKFFIKNTEDEAQLEVQSMRHSVSLNGDLIKEIQLLNKYEFYLN
ncbi:MULTISPECIES: DNA polymerase III subunit alpha [Chryseobacterium]|uniref:DNA polymerase III subunit alpha n=1 Tax=Chryseobacterium camelliae TaxID=1265445 RepID=A0ABU0TEP7_9FLAO|nr:MULTISPECIES: DNA polymerase III subunit alpha [Chryseobacterium]MDT3406727.1 DNA polymerase-3 subunit alpha [Pseudacidovorax intermedius]MDQ1095477.1 DNA polymerase-3 subunit alpha [Chryseobacterium camelliae]MDQ1099414.1 DNA polymerase-3 subunit alpha [Chryseobacterium sp. SORGH_AS_1048]MDR6086760.1 DNA polymerase-3 subunit alpha [Chryseobacterium sp. SORGH_AS_0909]MDR6131133.1 DNA polymerase-3 subunit alpha [Chryseobacterium sp. SORGH_AS_1175]